MLPVGSTEVLASVFSVSTSTAPDGSWTRLPRELLELYLRMAGDLSADDWSLIDHITTKKVARVAEEEKAKHCKLFQRLHKAQHPHFLPENRKTDVNLSAVPLEETDFLVLSKGLNYVVTPAVVPVEDIPCGVEKSIGVPPEETAKEVRQETVRFYNIPANQG
jgi:hypothetical protein